MQSLKIILKYHNLTEAEEVLLQRSLFRLGFYWVDNSQDIKMRFRLNNSFILCLNFNKENQMTFLKESKVTGANTFIDVDKNFTQTLDYLDNNYKEDNKRYKRIQIKKRMDLQHKVSR